MVHGGMSATPSLRKHFEANLQELNGVETWEELFHAVGSDHVPSKMEILEILQGCWDDGLRLGHFTRDTDFSRLQRSGTSNLFLVGASYSKGAMAIDRSGSMSLYIGNHSTTRYDAVCSHFMRMLEAKEASFAFSLLLFDHEIMLFQQGALVQNTPGNRDKVQRWLHMNRPNYGGTDLLSATQHLVRLGGANVEERFLLTDGESGLRGLLECVRDRKHRAPVNCIGVMNEDSRRARDVLEAIAETGGGEVVWANEPELTKEGNDRPS